MKKSIINQRLCRELRPLLLISLLLGSGAISVPAFAEATEAKSESGAAGMVPAMKEGSMQGGAAPEDARDPNAYSGGYEYRGMAGWEETDEIVFSKVIADQLEYRNNDGNDSLRWDIQGWRGTDYNKFWFKFEGEDDTSSGAGDLELQALYSHSIDPFWDFQIGARYDRVDNGVTTSNRFFAVIGLQGLAPYWFELEPAVFISEDGDVSARLVSTYDLLFTQRLILQPRLEVNAAANEVREFGIGKGINDIQLGFRLRYEIMREVAPYIGLSWSKLVGNTEDMARAAGEDVNNFAVVVGIRLWF